MSSLIIGKSPLIQELHQWVEKLSHSKANVLIIGESGTGKELVARMTHDSGPLKDFPFIPINCGAIPENLIESELFGHQKGSFTGAIQDKKGLFELAHRGTLFLDEIGELPLSMQAKLLRVLQERTFKRVGGTEDIRVDVRIIAATNKNLESEVKAGAFREDLFYRLNVILIQTPSLRERKEDIPLLVEEFLKKSQRKLKKELMGIHSDAMDALLSYHWPGNVRELENVIEHSVALEVGKSISLQTLPAVLFTNFISPKIDPVQIKKRDQQLELIIQVPNFADSTVLLDEILQKVEGEFIKKSMLSAENDKNMAAKLLGITNRSLRYRLKKLGITRAEE